MPPPVRRAPAAAISVRFGGDGERRVAFESPARDIAAEGDVCYSFNNPRKLHDDQGDCHYDSRAARQQVANVLVGAGFEIIEAVDGNDGLEKIAANADARVVILATSTCQISPWLRSCSRR